MKKQLTIIGISILLMTGVTFTASAQKKEGKNNKKEQEHNAGKNNDKPAKANNSNTARNENHSQNSNSVKQGKNNNKPANASNGNAVKNENNGVITTKKYKESNGKSYVNADKIKNNGKGNNGKNNTIKLVRIDNNNLIDGYKWNSETFKNRNKIKDQEKVTICHKLKGDNEPGVAISVSSNALKAHMNHGDVMGGCPEVKSNIYSSTYLQKRANYYNIIENNNEQVSYSRSIYDYAVARLTNSRLQLVTLQNNNMPVAEIERKQAVVVELEQNVSLLETLIGVATNIVVNKLQ